MRNSLASRDVPIRTVLDLRRDVIDLTGQRFGDWLVLRVAFRRVYAGNHRPQHLYWLCRCLGCGETYVVRGSHLRRTDWGRSDRCVRCARALSAERGRAMSRRVGDGRTVAEIALATGLKLDTVYHRLVRGWKRDELGAPLRRNIR